MSNELDHVSHSQLSLWDKCPRQWESRYIHGVRTPSNENLIIGSCYHSAIEAIYRFKIEHQGNLDVDICYDIYSTAWEKYKVDNGTIIWLKHNEGNAKDLGFNLVELYLERVAPSITPKLIEQWYEAFIDDTKFVLRLDLMDINGAVIDHKTSAKRYLDVDVHKDAQASATAFALGRPIVFYNHVAIKTKKPDIQVLKTMRNNADIEWWWTKARSTIVHMRSGYAPPRDNGWWCSPSQCGIYDTCMKDLTRTMYIQDDGGIE